MKRFLSLSAALVALATMAGVANAQNVVNGVDRNSQAYRTAYLNTANPGTCDANLYQFDGYHGGAKVSVTPLWASNPVQAQACTDATGSGGTARGGLTKGADGSPQ